MEGVSVLIAGALLAMWPRRPWQYWGVVALLLLTSTLSLLYTVSNRFTGEGITLVVLAHIVYGWRDGELEVGRFPWLIVGITFFLGSLGTWSLLCWRWMQIRKNGQNPMLRWLAVPTALVALMSNPAAQDIWLLQQATENAGTELHAELQWKISPNSSNARPFAWIYLESFERAFLDQKLLPNVAPNLAKLEQQHLSFRGIRTAPFMKWTVAGMVASQCGMPFEPTAKQVDGYQAGASCLGDLLVEHDYTLSYVGGQIWHSPARVDSIALMDFPQF